MFTDINLNTQKLNETKKAVMTNISKRHTEARKEITKSLEVIYGFIDPETNTDNELDDISKELEALLND